MSSHTRRDRSTSISARSRSRGSSKMRLHTPPHCNPQQTFSIQSTPTHHKSHRRRSPPQNLLSVPRLSIAPMVDVTNVFFRLFNRIVSHNTTLYTEMIVDKQILNSLPFTRASIGVMHPRESASFKDNMKRFYSEQYHKQFLNLKKKHVTKNLEDATTRSPSTDNSRFSPNVDQSSFLTTDSNVLLQEIATKSTTRLPLHTAPLELVLPSLNPVYPFTNGGGCVAQISGADGYELIAAATMLQTLGYDVININFGCPASSASSGLHGAILMVSPDVEKQIERLRSNPIIHTPLSIKCRIGVNKPADYRWFKEWLMSYITHTGVSWYIIHSRIAKLNFNPKKNLNIPPLHREFVHYLQTDIRQYLNNEKLKLFMIMDQYYKEKAIREKQIDQKNCTPENGEALEQFEPPFGISGRHKNACLYYIDPKTRQKCYVPLSVCLEYNGGAITPSQTAELSWALTEEGGYRLRPKLNNFENTNENEMNDNATDEDILALYDYFNYRQHKTMVHRPNESTHDGISNGKVAQDAVAKASGVTNEINYQDDFLWMNKTRRGKNQSHIQNDKNDHTLLINSYSNTTPSPTQEEISVVDIADDDTSLTLKQPLLPGIMVGRADMGDVLFPMFYDAFYHALVLASNGKLDSIPNLLLPHTSSKLLQSEKNDNMFSTLKHFQSIDNYNDFYDHTDENIHCTYQNPPENSEIGGEEEESIDANKILYNLLQDHLNTDPIVHNSNVYIDVSTGTWVKTSDKLKNTKKSNNNGESSIKSDDRSMVKNVYDLPEIDRMKLISGYPSEAYPQLPPNPSRLDLLCVYLDEVDKLLFSPNYARDLQMQYEQSLPHDSNNDMMSSLFYRNNNNVISTPLQQPQHQLNTQQIAPLSTSNSTTMQSSSQSYVSFLDNTTPIIHPHESIQLSRQFNITPFDQQAIITGVVNPIAPQLSLPHQLYPYNKDESKCSFQIFDDNGNNNDGHNDAKVTETLNNNSIHTKDKSHPYYATPHPFVEGICKVVVSQELLDMSMLLDSLSYHCQKMLYTRDPIKYKSLKPSKPNKDHIFLDLSLLHKGITQFIPHPFIEKMRYKYSLQCAQHAEMNGMSDDTLSASNDAPLPKWLMDFSEYNSVVKYHDIITELQQYITLQSTNNNNNNNNEAIIQQFIIDLISVFDKDFATPKTENHSIFTKTLQLHTLQHTEFSSSILRSKTLTRVGKLQRMTESQSVSSLFYGYLYGISDMFIRPLSSLFANTDGNEQWRKTIHTACLIARGSMSEIFELSSFWTHNNQPFGGTDMTNKEQVANLSNKQKLILEWLSNNPKPPNNDENDKQHLAELHSDYIYMGTSGDRLANDRVAWNKTTLHTIPLDNQSTTSNQSQLSPLRHNDNCNNQSPKKRLDQTIKPPRYDYNIDKLLYDPSTMALYPLTLLDKYDNTNCNNGETRNSGKLVESLPISCNNPDNITSPPIITSSATLSSPNITGTDIITPHKLFQINDQDSQTLKMRLKTIKMTGLSTLLKEQANAMIHASDPNHFSTLAKLKQEEIEGNDQNLYFTNKYDDLNTIPYQSHITTSSAPPQHIMDNDYAAHLKAKADHYYHQINKLATRYIKYNEKSLNNYLKNTAGYLDVYYNWEGQRDEDRTSFVKAQRDKVDNFLKNQQQPEVNTNNNNNISDKSNELGLIKPNKVTNMPRPTSHTPQLGDAYYSHINIDPSYITRRNNLIQSTRRVHLAFLQRFPFDLDYVGKDNLKQMLHFVGGDIHLYDNSPILSCGSSDGKSTVTRRIDEIELEQYKSRHNLDSISWLYYILNHTNPDANYYNVTPHSQSINTTSTTTTKLESSHERTNITMTDLILPTQSVMQELLRQQPTNTTSSSTDIYAEIKDIMPMFVELCHIYPILTPEHSFQYLTERKVNIHSALTYLKQQIAVIDSVTLPPEFNEALNPHDMTEMRRNYNNNGVMSGIYRDILRQPVVDEKLQASLWNDAKKVLSQMNGVL